MNTPCQLHFKTGEFSGSEDCLYLNVFTPSLATGSKLLPVIVHIPGGGFICGNGTMKELSNPESLVEKGVVVVSINYRVGVFGFFSLDIPEAAGNMGLKDQVKALEWVQRNIYKFGGDKDNVTLLGMSAGSASVEFQILSPMAKGLFHRAILQSGSAINEWAIGTHYEKLTLNLANKLEYKADTGDKRALYEFFLKVSSKDLTEASANVTANFPAKNLLLGFVPIVERIKEGAFLTTHPYTLFKEGNFTKVPFIRGFCRKEGFLTKITKPEQINELIAHKHFVDYFSHELEDNEKAKYSKKFTDTYFETANSNADRDPLAVDFFGDTRFAAGSWVASILSAKHGATGYAYIFSYEGKLNS